METERERRAARLAIARRKLAGFASSPVEPELLSEIERVHGQVEAIERQLQAAKFPALAIRARQKLVVAQAAERELLAVHGYDSWLGLQLRRVEHLLNQPLAEELEAAELEHRRALAAWQELAEATDPSPGGQEVSRPPQAMATPTTIHSVLAHPC